MRCHLCGCDENRIHNMGVDVALLVTHEYSELPADYDDDPLGQRYFWETSP